MIEPARMLRPAKIALPVLALASLLLYAAGVVALRQDRAPGWSVEALGALPVAVSHLVYGSPLGGADDNVMRRFLHPDGASTQELVALAASKSIPPGKTDMYSVDAPGVGTNIFATVAMELFGISIGALVKFYLVLVGLSAVVFTLRFHDRRLLVVPLYFLAATAMLFTPLATNPHVVDQAPIGGQRYFVMAAILPALHLFFEIIEPVNAAARQRRLADWLLLFVQAAFLFFVVLVRSSMAYLVGVLVAILLWRLWRDRKRQGEFASLGAKTAIIGAALALWTVFVAVALPDYVHRGRTLGIFWHRAFISFGLHPDWPFGNLREVYACPRFDPNGFSHYAQDSLAHCVWFAYPPNQTRPVNELADDLYNAEYERVVRNAFFYVVTHYPRQTFELYAFVKTASIKNVLVGAGVSLLDLPQARVPKVLFGIGAAQGLAFMAFVLALVAADRRVIDRRMAIVPAFFVASLAPLYVAWGVFATSADTICLFFCCLVLAVLLLAQLAAQALAAGVTTSGRKLPLAGDAGLTPQ